MFWVQMRKRTFAFEINWPLRAYSPKIYTVPKWHEIVVLNFIFCLFSANTVACLNCIVLCNHTKCKVIPYGLFLISYWVLDTYKEKIKFKIFTSVQIIFSVACHNCVSHIFFSTFLDNNDSFFAVQVLKSNYYKFNLLYKCYNLSITNVIYLKLPILFADLPIKEWFLSCK